METDPPPGAPDAQATVRTYTGGRLTETGFDPTPPARRPPRWLPIAVAAVVVAVGVAIAVPFLSGAPAPVGAPGPSASVLPSATQPTTGQADPAESQTATIRVAATTRATPVAQPTTPLLRCLRTLGQSDLRSVTSTMDAELGIAGYDAVGIKATFAANSLSAGIDGVTSSATSPTLMDIDTGQIVGIGNLADLGPLADLFVGASQIADLIAPGATFLADRDGKTMTYQGRSADFGVSLTPQKPEAVVAWVVQLPRAVVTASFTCQATTYTVEVTGFTNLGRTDGSPLTGVECGKPTAGMNRELAEFTRTCAALVQGRG